MQDDAVATGLHSALQPLGAHAQHIDVMWQTMLWVCGLMYVLVLVFLALALWRRREQENSRNREGSRGQKRFSVLLAIWTGLIATCLFALTLTSFLTDRALARSGAEPQVALQITANQWWWEVEYADPDPSLNVRTANEIHLPVNASVHIQLASNDVIHSFWVPNLHGKRDLIPGRSNEIRLQPRQVGTFRGECAEFCGVQHAKMAFDVIVESEQDFRAWRDRQVSDAVAPSNPQAQQGQRVFFDSGCSLCHAISGTPAAASVAPDLSHLASRRTLAAGALANTPENLRQWIENPQRHKPGNHMPVVGLEPQQLDALVAYLGSLQ
jgi:cytochrome c oxidase subunit II